MKECITHHHACDCREAEFAKWKAAYEEEAQDHTATAVSMQRLISQLESENEKLKRIVEVLEKSNTEVIPLLERMNGVFPEDESVDYFYDIGHLKMSEQAFKAARQAKEEVERIRGEGR